MHRRPKGKTFVPRKKTVQQRYGQKKPTPNLKKRLVITGFGFALIAAIVGLGSFVMMQTLEQSDFFQITAIRIQGCLRTTKHQIMELSGVDVQTNLLALNLDKVKTQIESHAWVESAEVARNWPNRLNISIKERVPVAMVSLEEGLFYLDKRGVAFARVLPPEDMDYPVITGLSVHDLPKTLYGSPLNEALKFIHFAGRGSSVLPGQNISEVHLLPEGDMILYLVNRPFPIYLGKSEMATKYYRLAKVLYRLYKEKEFTDIAYIRMDYMPDKVLVGKTGSV